MRDRRVTLILASLTLLALVSSLPGSAREAFERGGLYLFSQAFFEDLPNRLTGPGRFRFVLQLIVAILLGMRDGLSDARAGRLPYLYNLLFSQRKRRELLRSGFDTVVNLILMGILLDAIAQWLILGVSYPGAALVVGPVLIPIPLCACACVDKSRHPVAQVVKEKTMSDDSSARRSKRYSLFGKMQTGKLECFPVIMVASDSSAG